MRETKSFPENVDLDSEGVPPLEGAYREGDHRGSAGSVWPPVTVRLRIVAPGHA